MSARHDEGLRVRREVLGAEYVDGAMAAADGLQSEFQSFVTEHCWGTVWTDETLSRRERSLLVLAITAAQGRMSEFRLHVRGALNNGVTPAELAAVLRQLGVYAGIPAAVSGMRVMTDVLREHVQDGNGGAEQ